MIREIPRDILIGFQEAWNLSGVTISAGRGYGRSPDRTRTDGGGWWVMSAERIIMRDTDWFRTWRTIRMLGDGGATPLIVHRHEQFQPWATVGASLLTGYGSIPHSDDALFDDGTGYWQPAIIAQLASSAALRATTLSITLLQGAAFQGGEVFSIDHPTFKRRMYEIIAVNVNGTVQIRPPLREAAAAGTTLDFDRPNCVMRLRTPSAMNETLDPVHLVPHTFTFEEAFPPFV